MNLAFARFGYSPTFPHTRPKPASIRSAWLMLDVMSRMVQSSVTPMFSHSTSRKTYSRLALKSFGDVVSPFRTPLFTSTMT
ncbi:unnamed protein product [Heligmosomoides polygyrus]|uniref:Uncharacterized protein n=1 Tax=Heligmosomoides polygyrus TaxID=6339 RepID=A0A183GBB9_HELPZ|nr:unnamed protein product [Heligmosomoides polygyrus]